MTEFMFRYLFQIPWVDFVVWAEAKNQLFQKQVVLFIKFKGNKEQNKMHWHSFLTSLTTRVGIGGQKINHFLQKCVTLYIKLKRTKRVTKCKQIV